jgi:hypothetical protein
MNFGLLVLATPSSCKCRTGAQWSFSSRKCLLYCTSIAHVNTSIPSVPATNQNCTCKNSYTWNQTLLQCLPTRF